MFNVQSQPKALNKKPSKTCNNRHNTILLHDVGGDMDARMKVGILWFIADYPKIYAAAMHAYFGNTWRTKGIKIGAKDERFKHILHNYTSNNASKRQQIIYTSSFGAVLNAAAEQLRRGRSQGINNEPVWLLPWTDCMWLDSSNYYSLDCRSYSSFLLLGSHLFSYLF